MRQVPALPLCGPLPPPGRVAGGGAGAHGGDRGPPVHFQRAPGDGEARAFFPCCLKHKKSFFF